MRYKAPKFEEFDWDVKFQFKYWGKKTLRIISEEVESCVFLKDHISEECYEEFWGWKIEFLRYFEDTKFLLSLFETVAMSDV